MNPAPGIPIDERGEAVGGDQVSPGSGGGSGVGRGSDAGRTAGPTKAPDRGNTDQSNPDGVLRPRQPSNKDITDGVNAPNAVERPAIPRGSDSTQGDDAKTPEHPSKGSGASGNRGAAGQSDREGAPGTAPTGGGTSAPEPTSPPPTESASPSESHPAPASEQTAPPKPAPETDPVAESGASSARGESTAGDAPHQPGSATHTTRPEDITLPDLEVDGLETDANLLEEATRFQAAPSDPLAGIWEQVGGPTDSDFGPGGYERSVIALNPSNKSLSIYREYRGGVSIVVGGVLAFDSNRESGDAVSGTLVIRVDPSLKSKFRDRPLNLGGAHQVVMTPPAGNGPWQVPWARKGVELVLGEKRYAPSDRETFERIRSGGGDLFQTSDAAMRVPPRDRNDSRGDSRETSFFGLRGGGKRVCFIVDVSGSMSDNDKIGRLRTELTNTIRAFQDEQLFSVVFFSSDVHVIDQSWMKARADRDRAIDLIMKQGPESGTDPTAAFRFAFENLSPTPDCVYFMTDGQVPAGLQIIELIRQLNAARNPTQIHTINFGEPASTDFMKQIAKENRGNYVFVPM